MNQTNKIFIKEIIEHHQEIHDNLNSKLEKNINEFKDINENINLNVIFEYEDLKIQFANDSRHEIYLKNINCSKFNIIKAIQALNRMKGINKNINYFKYGYDRLDKLLNSYVLVSFTQNIDVYIQFLNMLYYTYQYMDKLNDIINKI